MGKSEGGDTPPINMDEPRLARSDVWLLRVLGETRRPEERTSLRELIERADFVERDVPTFDQISFGIPRLVAAGYITVEAGAFRATGKGIALRKSVQARTLGGVLREMIELLGLPPLPSVDPVPEDRSLGRLAGLEPIDYDEAVAAYRAGFSRDWAGCLVLVGSACVAILAAGYFLSALVPMAMGMAFVAVALFAVYLWRTVRRR
jgi:hypothetical protein